MTRLDQLSQSRTARKVGRTAGARTAVETNDEQKGLGQTDSDVSKSMTHLTGSGEKSPRRSVASSRSMIHVGPPRMTRAERLRKLARQTNAASTVADAPTTSAKHRETSPSGKISKLRRWRNSAVYSIVLRIPFRFSDRICIRIPKLSVRC